MSMHEKSFNVDVPPEVSQAFTDHIDGSGYTKWKAIMGALKVYMLLPADVQVCANNPSKMSDDVRATMDRVYEDRFRLKFLDTLTPSKEDGADAGKDPIKSVPLLTLRIERKKKQVYQQLLKTVADSPDLPESLKMKIEQDLTEAMKQLSQQTRKIRQDMLAKED